MNDASAGCAKDAGNSFQLGSGVSSEAVDRLLVLETCNAARVAKRRCQVPELEIRDPSRWGSLQETVERQTCCLLSFHVFVAVASDNNSKGLVVETAGVTCWLLFPIFVAFASHSRDSAGQLKSTNQQEY